jgi:hypothetical protein
MAGAFAALALVALGAAVWMAVAYLEWLGFERRPLAEIVWPRPSSR